MFDEMTQRIINLKDKGEDYERGVTYFSRLLFAFLISGKGEFADPSALEGLAKVHREMKGSLPKSEVHSGFRQGFEEELDFFSRLVDRVKARRIE